MATRLVWGSDLYKGFKLPNNTLLGGAIDDILPFQMLTLEEKTPDWIHAVADYYETAGWNNVEKKAGKIQGNYMMREGKLNPSDYIVNPTQNDYYQAVGWMMPPESSSPLEQFYPIAPNFIEILRGEHLKRDNRWTVEAIDPYSISQVFKFKNDKFKQILMDHAVLEKQQAMAAAGLTEKTDPQQYQQQLQELQQRMEQVEFQTKNFRTKGVQWIEKVIKIQDKRYDLAEIEPDGFECGLITDSEFWHLDMLDDDFKLNLLNPKWCDYHKGPGRKYVSDGDYFLYFDWMSCGDIANSLGRRMKEEDLLKLKEIYVKTANIIVPDYLKARQGAYYDLSKPWSQATEMDPEMNDALLGKELAYNFMRTPNFDHNQEVDILNPVWGRLVTGHPQMFRVMRLYWRALRRIGWLTKVERDGTPIPGTWIDETYKVTIDPVYDTSVVKEESKDNLVYGEHIDWNWAPEWRHTIKISPNQKHTFWLNSRNSFESIYLDGGPTPFQFKGKNDPFNALPPVEGCQFTYINSTGHSLIDRIRPMQVLYNITMNKVPKKILEDYGNKIAVDKRSYSVSNPSINSPTVDPRQEYEDRLMESPILEYAVSRDALEGMGQPALPQLIQMSTVGEAQAYIALSQQIKWEAGEIIGITRQRAGGQKASETAYSVQQGIQYSETQTEKYFEQHSNLMERVRQRMVDAAQYYSTFKQHSKDVYINDDEENVLLEIEGMENTFPQYNIYLQSRANARAALQTITGFLKEENTLPIQPSAKIQALVEQSIPKILSLIKQGEIEADMKAEQERQHEIQLEQEKRKTLMEQLKATQDFQASEGDKNRAKDIEVASIKELGGMQTDVNANAIPDAQDNLQYYLQHKEMESKASTASEANNLKRQTELDKLTVEREKSQMDLKKTETQGEYALRVAKENKTAAELKRKQAKK